LSFLSPAENKHAIVAAGALNPLIILLGTESAEVQCNACGCITTLATTEANKIKIVQQGAVAALLKLTRVHDPRVQRNAAGALLNLTHIGMYSLITLCTPLAKRPSLDDTQALTITTPLSILLAFILHCQVLSRVSWII